MRAFLLPLALGTFAFGCGGSDDDGGTDTDTTDTTDAAGDDDDDTNPGDDDDDGTPLPTEPVDDAGLAGRTYVVDLGSGNFVEPPGVGPLLSQFLTTEILLGVVTADATTLQLRGAIADAGGAQDPCSPSIEFPAADFDNNPTFSVGPETLNLDIEGIAIVIEDLEVTGGFATGGSAIVAATLAGSIDTRILAPLVGATGDDQAVCDLVSTFGVACVACSDGSGNYCLNVYVDRLRADEAPGVTLTEITQADADAACP